MRVLIQWTRSTPRGWEEIDSTQWRSLPRRPDPTGADLSPDDAPGWVYRLCAQGLEFTADHYAVESLPARGCRVTIWNDDPSRYPPGERYARVWTLRPIAPDPKAGGRWNTAQSQVIYAEPGIEAKMRAMGEPTQSTGGRAVLLPWEDFAPPEEAIVRHGKGVSEALNEQHDAMRSRRGWREWTEGVPARAVDERGLVSRSARG